MSDSTPSKVPSSSADLAALRAAAAQAAAEAAEAKAQAAALALAAAEAAAAEGATPAATPAPAADVPAPALSEHAAQIVAGYTFTGPMLPVGALVEDDVAIPGAPVGIPLAMMNRHGLVAGATGTGKTRTLQVLTEGLSAAGVPVFVADIKGDLSGLAVPGTSSEKLLARTVSLGQEWVATASPVEFYSLGGLGEGTPVRTTVTDFGPLLLAKVLGLNATQESSLGLIMHWADTQGLAPLDLKDLQATIAYLVSDEGKPLLKGIGGLSASTAGVILREIVSLQGQGADAFFGEPAFDVSELLRTTPDGRGVVSALELPAVQDRPALFSTFLMWLLAELFQELPEVGDPDKPKLVFFFDEAHLLFTGASGDFLTQVTQTVRLIRSKGVGVFFVTQSPKDVPGDVLAQLGNRVQHALRAFTPDDAKALRAAARTFPTSPYDLEQLLQSLGTGEAVVTVQSERGTPTPVAWTRLRAPQSSMEPMPAAQLTAAVTASPLSGRYAVAVDRESAYELLAVRAEKAQEAARKQQEAEEAQDRADEAAREAKRAAPRRSTSRTSPLDSLLRSAGTQLGREITRSIFGTRRR
ncbi:helicase HerA-like domain-containing protein [Cellulomonas sp. Leaf334]|uniref:helicase HerA-like domain-containing protein n=1 Tax=Cellulomonas sp. Leaf334 TaxID=1736339 RepID=UPI0006F8BD04|nr:helicase HerA-like domain-containing protein [Cellulomonas sp. Leaf334]KQR16556.1 ATPase [Cellulomonas sp. Leaf334]